MTITDEEASGCSEVLIAHSLELLADLRDALWQGQNNGECCALIERNFLKWLAARVGSPRTIETPMR
jgi:hypothetical protein